MTQEAATAAAPGRREQTKQANREAILLAAREVFADIGYGAATVRDIVRGTSLASGTFYNYFPDKEAVLRALLSDLAGEVRARVRAARRSAVDLETFLASSFGAYYAYLASEPQLFELIHRNTGTIRAMFDEPAIGAGTAELAEDLREGVARGVLPDHDTELMARAMVGAGFEVAVLMLDRDPPDVDGAVAFITRLFAGGLREAGC